MEKLIILFLMLTTTYAAFPITRHNVGTFLNPLPGVLINGNDIQPMILAIRYEIPIPPPKAPDFTNELKKLTVNELTAGPRLDPALTSQVKTLQQLIGTADFQIIEAVSTAKLFLSNPIRNNEDDRSKRGAPLPFLGEIFKGIMGLVTQSDLENILKNLINIDIVLQAMRTSDYKVAQFLEKLTTKVDVNYKIIVDNEHKTEQVLKDISTNIDTFTSNFTNTLSLHQSNTNIRNMQLALVTDATTALNYRLHFLYTLNTIIQTLRSLSQGILTPDLVSPTNLTTHLNDMERKIQKEAPGSQVIIKQAEYYYTQKLSRFLYSKDYLYIYLDIPISATDSLFDIYKVQIIPVPINTNSTTALGTTSLLNEVEFLATNKDRSLFLELNSEDVLLCPGEAVKVCSNLSPRIHANKPTCMAAIFQNNASKIKHLCEFKIAPLAPIRTHAITIAQDKYLISTHETFYTLNCHGKPSQVLNSKALFIATVPCTCTLNVGHMALPNSKVICNKSDPLVIKYTINLPFLHAFKVEENIITPTDELNTPYTYKPPTFTSFLHTLHENSIMDTTSQIDLHPFAVAVLENAKRIPLPPSLLDELTMMEQIASSPIWEYVMAAISIAGFILAAYCTFKIHCMGPAFSFLPQAHAYRFVLDHTPKPEAQTTPFSSESFLPPNFAASIVDHKDTHSIVVILLFALGLYIAVKILRRLISCFRSCIGRKSKARRSNPDIMLKIYKQKSNYSIPLTPIPYERDQIQTCYVPKIISMKAHPCPRPYIEIIWSGKAGILVDDSIIEHKLPNLIPLPFKAWFNIIPAINNKTIMKKLVLSPDQHHPTRTLPVNIIEEEEYVNDNVQESPKTITELAKCIFKDTIQVVTES